MSAGQIVQVDPATLTIALNVRTDVKVDKEFVASIKELGILQPPMVVKNGDGYDVVLGQRRTLAAVEAGLKQIPVYLVEKAEADAARVVDQLTENEQRQHLSESEVVGGYKQLALFGLSPSQIAKKVARPRKTVDTALAVAEDERAAAALDEGMTLDQAAVLVEFAGDKAAVKKLTESAGRGDFDHIVAGLREKRELAALIVLLTDELAGEKITILPKTDNEHSSATLDGHTVTKLERLGKPSAPTEALERADVKVKKHLAGRLATGYMMVAGMWKQSARIQYYVIDAEANGFAMLERVSVPARELTAEEQAEADAREVRWAAQRAERAALEAAAGVRETWLKEFLQRKSLPDDVLAFVATAMIHDGVEADGDTLRWLGCFPDEALAESLDEEDWVVLLKGEAARVGQVRFLVATAVDSAERWLGYWNGPAVAAWYLLFLESWGYGLSDAERGLLAVEDVDAA